jgi:GDP-L-fucose synthase
LIILSHPIQTPIPRKVGEDEEVSIKVVADAIVKAVGFKGDYTVIWLMGLPLLKLIGGG